MPRLLPSSTRCTLAFLFLLAVVLPPWSNQPLRASPVQPTLATAPTDAPMLAQTAPNLSTGQRVFLPLIHGQGLQLSHEVFPLDLAEPRTIQALNGRIQIELPARSVAYWYLGVTLHVLSPDPNAAWPEFGLYFSYASPPQYPYSYLIQPMTLTFSYANLPMTFVDEARLTMRNGASFDWFPVEGQTATTVEPNQHQITPRWETSVDPATKQLRLVTNLMTSVPRLDRGYQISDLAAGPASSFYAFADPIIYQANLNGTMTRVVDLDARLADTNLILGLKRFAVDPTSMTFFLDLRAKNTNGISGIYALQQGSLSLRYAYPAGYGATALAYHPTNDLLYVNLATVQSNWFGCAIYANRIQVLSASNGTEQASLNLNTAYISPLKALHVSPEGQLMGLQPTVSCNSSEYDGSQLLRSGTTLPLAYPNQTYPGFRGAHYLTSDGQGRSYIANYSANVISVVQGLDAELIGAIAVPAPEAMVVLGNTLVVISQGQLATRATNQLMDGGFRPNLVERSLTGKPYELTVRAPRFANPPAHNVLYYAGKRVLMDESEERAFRHDTTELHFPITVSPPEPTSYQPLSAQAVTVSIRTHGITQTQTTIAAPTIPYQHWYSSSPPYLTVARYGWAMLHVDGDLTSIEGLFPPIEARPGGLAILVHFPNLGTFHFRSLKDGREPITLTVEVSPYGELGGVQRTIDPRVGNIFWVGGAAFEIPAGALPARAEGYQIQFAASQNNYLLRDQPSERSPRYSFKITPEVTNLQRDLLLHLPAPTTHGKPVLAFYDEVLGDACALPGEDHPNTPEYQLLRLPAGTYPASTTQVQAELALINPSASQSWWRRSLNWLGNTSVWNAVGLPNEKVEDAFFSVLYNTRDGVSEAYAQRLLNALNTSRNRLRGMGYPVPTSQVIVKIAPWATKITESDGFVPGIGTLGNWYMFFNDKLSDNELQATAAHEFFHIVQKETSTSARLIAPPWWMEGTAVWAEYAVFPEITSYQQCITTGADFITKGLRNWDSSAETQYATVAFAIFLEDEYGAGTIKKVFEALGPFTGIETALQQATGKSLSEQIERFAQLYFQQQRSPYRDWTIVNAISNYQLAQAENDLFNRTAPALSAALVRATYDPNKSPKAPISFTASDGSVARMLQGCSTMRAWLLDAQRQAIGMSFIGIPDPNQGQVLSRLAEYRVNNPLYALVVPGDQQCTIKLRLETPTVTNISPASIPQNQAATITVYGEGFGPNEGLRVLAGGGIYSPSSFGPNSLSFNFPASAYPGTVSIRVQHKSGPISNPVTLTITAP